MNQVNILASVGFFARFEFVYDHQVLKEDELCKSAREIVNERDGKRGKGRSGSFNAPDEGGPSEFYFWICNRRLARG